MRGYYESAPIFSQGNANPASVEPSLRSRFYGAGKSLPNYEAVEAEKAAAARFGESQVKLKRAYPVWPNPSSQDAAIFSLAGPVYVEVEYKVVAECDGDPEDPDADFYGEVSPHVVRLLISERHITGTNKYNINGVWAWSVAPDALKSVVAHPNAQQLGYDNQRLADLWVEQKEAAEREQGDGHRY